MPGNNGCGFMPDGSTTFGRRSTGRSRPGGDLSIGLRLTANSVRLWLQLSLTLEYVARIERALPRLAELPQPDPVIEMRLWIAFGYAIWYSASRRDVWRPRSRVRWNWPISRGRVGQIAGALGHVGDSACRRQVSGGAGSRGQTTRPWPVQRVIRRTWFLATGSWD